MIKENLPYRKSPRLQGWDYRNPGLYFVTICTKNKEPFFGEIRDGVMGLSIPGCIAWYYWREIPRHQSRVVLDEFIVMPDHVHGIVGITSPGLDNDDVVVGTCHGMSLLLRNELNQHLSGNTQTKFGKPVSKSLSMIINHYKGAVTRWCRQNGHEYFEWQSRFYDHIIRNEKSLEYIREYIFNNPFYWESDQEYPDRVHDRVIKYMAE